MCHWRALSQVQNERRFLRPGPGDEPSRRLLPPDRAQDVGSGGVWVVCRAARGPRDASRPVHGSHGGPGHDGDDVGDSSCSSLVEI
jgi:hypothetical protein